MSKKFLSVLLALVFVVGVLPAAGAAATDGTPQFSDMPDSWATEALESAVKNGLLLGEDGKIMPDSPLTRAQMATIIVRAFGATEEGDISAYSDVHSTDWFASSMAKAYKMGIIQGYNGKMDPNSSITREQAFAVLARALKLKPTTTISRIFEDAGDISDWAKAEIYALVDAGYIQGSNDRLSPQASISRAEFAQVMHNIIKQYLTQEGVYTEVATGNIMVNAPGVTLKNVSITGDLIIGDGVGDGTVTLDNVTIQGNLTVRGGGVNSILIVGGGVVGNIIIAKVDGHIRVFADGGAAVDVIIIDDGKDEVIIEGTVGTIVVGVADVPVVVRNATVGRIEVVAAGAANITIEDNAVVSDVVVNSSSSGTTLNVKGRVNAIETSAANTAVAGAGTVSTVTTKVGADNTSVTTPRTRINNSGASEVTAGSGKGVPLYGSATNNNQGTGIVTPSSGDDGPAYVGVSGITVEPTDLRLGVGETATVTATVKPNNATNKTVIWATSDAEIATVDTNGFVTAVEPGEATITATADGKTAEVVISVLEVATEEENEDMGVFLIGWNTLRPFNEVRGNYVSYQFKINEEIKELSEVKVSIFMGNTKLATNSLIDPSKCGDEITGSFYTNDIKSTSSWYVEPITGNLGDQIFDGLELRVVYNDKVYIISQTELRPIVGNVKNLTQSKGYDTIQAAIDAATAGDNVIVVNPGDYGTASIDILQQEGVNITLEAVGEVVLNNQIRIDGAARHAGAESITIKGFTFDFSDAETSIITTTFIGQEESRDRTLVYAHNVFIENCEFIGNPDADIVAVVAGTPGGHVNFSIKDCTGVDLHSLGQLYVGGLTVENCTVSASEGGLNLQNSTDIAIRNFNVVAEEYGVRAGQGSRAVNETGILEIYSSNMSARYPIWLRGDAPGTVKITNSVLTPIDDGEMIHNVATGTVTITIDGEPYVTTETDLELD